MQCRPSFLPREPKQGAMSNEETADYLALAGVDAPLMPMIAEGRGRRLSARTMPGSPKNSITSRPRQAQGAALGCPERRDLTAAIRLHK